MGKVCKLSEGMVRGIAAGEVVERPASVVKELIENSVDAGAARVEVEWREAGRRRLKVVDDGEGMTPDDARLALERHATSKITSMDDLERVQTFGFRGEALPSIFAVSRFELVTRPPAAAEGWALRGEGGRIVFDGPAGAPAGTSVTADDLFFAVPARLKFLKADATERALLTRAVEDAAFSAPKVAWRAVSEGKEILRLPALGGEADLVDRLEALWGPDRARRLKPVDEAGRFLRVFGWVSDVNAPQSTARYQRFFINRRAVTSRRLLHALYDGYKGRLLAGRHPAALLFLEVDPSTVDVNVHPAKREVRLSHESEVHDFLCRAVQNALARSVQPRTFFVQGREPLPEEPPPRAREVGETASFRRPTWPSAGRTALPLKESQTALALQSPLAAGAERATAGEVEETVEGLTTESFRAATFEPMAQLYATYVLARLDHQFFIFDQHAADERVLYDILTAREKSGSHARQSLLLPWVWDPSAEGSAVVEAHREDFEKLGFQLESFGGTSWRIVAVPAALSEGHRARALLEGLAEDLLTGRIPRGWDALVTRAACRGSVRAGDPLSIEEMRGLITRLQSSAHPWTCPHGRPSFVRLSDNELAKRFRRLG